MAGCAVALRDRCALASSRDIKANVGDGPLSFQPGRLLTPDGGEKAASLGSRLSAVGEIPSFIRREGL